jgi:hypothetical protein
VLGKTNLTEKMLNSKLKPSMKSKLSYMQRKETKMDKVTEERYFTANRIYSPAERIEHQKQAIKLKSKDLNGNPATIFNLVANPVNWKKATTPAIVSNIKQVYLLRTVIDFYVGGSEVDKISENVYVITSKGYYFYYIGA